MAVIATCPFFAEDYPFVLDASKSDLQSLESRAVKFVTKCHRCKGKFGAK